MVLEECGIIDKLDDATSMLICIGAALTRKRDDTFRLFANAFKSTTIIHNDNSKEVDHIVSAPYQNTRLDMNLVCSKIVSMQTIIHDIFVAVSRPYFDNSQISRDAVFNDLRDIVQYDIQPPAPSRPIRCITKKSRHY